MINLIRRIRTFMQGHFFETTLHKGHNMAHMSYLGLVAIESHGYYGKAALVLLIIAIVAHLIGMGDME